MKKIIFPLIAVIVALTIFSEFFTGDVSITARLAESSHSLVIDSTSKLENNKAVREKQPADAIANDDLDHSQTSVRTTVSAKSSCLTLESSRDLSISEFAPISLELPIGLNPMDFDQTSGTDIQADIKACEQWLAIVDQVLTDNKNKSPAAESFERKLNKQARYCKALKSKAGRWARAQNLPEKIENGSNFELHSELIQLGKSGRWNEIIKKVERNEIPADYRRAFAHDIPSDVSLITLLIIFDAPDYVYSELIDLGIRIWPDDYRRALNLGKPTLLKVLSQKGVDLNRAVGQQNLYVHILNATEENAKKSIEQLHSLGVNPNYYFGSQVDALERILMHRPELAVDMVKAGSLVNDRHLALGSQSLDFVEYVDQNTCPDGG